MQDQPVTVGVDLGGTQMRAALVADDGKLVGPFQDTPTEAQGPGDVTISNLIALIERVLDGRDAASTRGIGVGSTGPHDPHTLSYRDPDSLPHLHGFPLARRCGNALAPKYA